MVISYTYHTLENLKKQNPDTDYYFIIGADSLLQFHHLDEARENLCCMYDRGCHERPYTHKRAV